MGAAGREVVRPSHDAKEAVQAVAHRKSHDALEDVQVGEGGCGSIWEGVFYDTKASLYEVYPVVAASSCKDICNAEPKCVVWSWGKVRGRPGVSDTCFLREHCDVGKVKADKAYTSGMACHRSSARLAPKGESVSPAWDPAAGACGPEEVAVSYWSTIMLYRMTPIHSAADCRAKCQALEVCVAWTWSRRAPKAPTCTLRAVQAEEEPLLAIDDSATSGLCHKGLADAAALGSSAPEPDRPEGGDSPQAQGATEAAWQRPVLPQWWQCGRLKYGVVYNHFRGRSLQRPAATSDLCNRWCLDEDWCRSWSWVPTAGDRGAEGDAAAATEQNRTGAELALPAGSDTQPRGKCILIADTQPRSRWMSGSISATGCHPSQGSAPHLPAPGPPWRTDTVADANASNVITLQPTGEFPGHPVHEIPASWEGWLEDGSWCPDPWGDMNLTAPDLQVVEQVGWAVQCQWMCTVLDDCGSWVWVAGEGDGLATHTCYLKQRGLSSPTPRPGLQSGRPCVLSPRTVQDSRPRQFYCWSLMQPNNYEVELIKLTYGLGTGIFACDGTLVVSSGRFEVAAGLWTVDVNHSLHCEIGGEFQTALNLDIFRAAWNKVVSVGDYREYQWTIKTDPDCVFFPSRLRSLLGDRFAGQDNVYLNNCDWGLHGPIEVLSRGAVDSWVGNMETCYTYFWGLCSGDCLWGEDMFMDQCFIRVLGAIRSTEHDLLLEDHCGPPPDWWRCTDNTKVAFHPYKGVGSFWACLDGAGAFRQPATEPLIAPPGQWRRIAAARFAASPIALS